MIQPACQSASRETPPRLSGARPVRRLTWRGAWHPGNMIRGGAATVAALALLAPVLGAGVTEAGSWQPTTENLAISPAMGDQVVTPDVAMACFSVVEKWVREWKEPAVADVPPAAVAAVQGASITLRRAGEIVGRGTALSLTGGEHALVAAAAAAWREASDRMPGDRDAFWVERMRAQAPEVMISVEVCSAPVTMSPLAFDEVDRDLAAGLEGVAARFGSRSEAIFPATMITRGLLPGDALASCIAVASDNPELGIRSNPLTQPPALAKTHQAVFYRFRPFHVAQTSPGGPARFLHRSARVIGSREITTSQLKEWAGLMADRLMKIAVDEPADVTDPPHPDAPGRICLKIPGTIFPATDKIEPEYAPARDQSIVAVALGRAGRSSLTLHAGGSERARNAAVRMLRDVLQHPAGGPLTVESDQDWISREVAYRELLSDLTQEQMYLPWHTSRGSAAITSWDPSVHVRRVESLAEGSPRAELPAEDRGRLAYALALRKAPEAGEHVRALYRELGIARLHEAMPWLGWADMKVADQTQSQPSVPLLREWRDAVYTKMIPMPAPGSETADLAGGFLWTANQRMPTSDSAGTVAFLATMTGDGRITDPGERAKELSRLLSTLRFLRQISMDEYSCYSGQKPEQAMWGVKRSPTELELRPGDSAMTLIAVCETLRAIEAMKKPD